MLRATPLRNKGCALRNVIWRHAGGEFRGAFRVPIPHLEAFSSGEEKNTRRKTNPWIRWVWYDIAKGSLLMLFLHVITMAGGMYYRWVDPLPYLDGVDYALGFGD